MNKKNHQDDNEKITAEFVERMLGLDTEALLKEYEAAEREVLEIKRTDPDAFGHPNDGFEELMKKVEAQNIQPIFMADLVGMERLTGRKVSRKTVSPKRKFRSLAIAALMVVLVLGSGIITYGRRGFRFWERPVTEEKNEVIWNNLDNRTSYASLEDSYREIKDILDITVIKLSYFPVGMHYEGYSIDEGRHSVILEFSYQDRKIWFSQQIRDVEHTRSMHVDMKRYTEVYNQWLTQSVEIAKNELEDGMVEYSGTFFIRDMAYTFWGVMEEDEFIKIVEAFRIYS